MDLSVVVACYDEAEHLEGSVARLVGLLDLTRLDYELIFVDDASRDGTRDLLARLPAAYPRHAIRVYLNDRNLGRGATVTRGLELARAPFAGFLDIDLEVDAVYVPAFYAALAAGADMVIGRRVYKLSRSTALRFVQTRGYILLRRAAIGLPFEDTEAGYKFFRLETAGRVLKECRDPGWFWDTEVIARAWDAGLRIDEVRCLFVRRRDKTSTVRPFRDAWRQARALLAFRRARRAERRLD